jgi:FKBP-type peptidyl-prolyl cis-trans isomerase 2/predicted Fe-Mo cluster-binding NifX family protein
MLMLIAIPSDAPGGLDSTISEHFGHCDAFTIVEVLDGEVGGVSIIANGGHEHGGCMAPVQLLKEKGVEVLLAGGMGQRPLAGFQQVGITVHFKGEVESVSDAVKLFIDGGCPAFDEAQTCGGGGGGCGGHHHHEEVQREPIEGVADIREGRIISLDFELSDSDGNLLDSSTRVGPIRYMHGAGQLIPALETAVDGLEKGAVKTVEIPCAEAFGPHDETRVIDVQRTQLPQEIAVGTVLASRDQHGRQIPLKVIEFDDETAKLDGNHPFAGKDVVFKITVANVENATAEELAHSRAH